MQKKKKRKMNTQGKEKLNSNKADLILLIIFNVKRLNTPNKSQRLSDWI